MNNQIITVYLVYLPISIAITIYVARQLFRNGKIFLYDIFHGNKELADAVNNLLLVGFYLLNIGYIVFGLTEQGDINTTRAVIEKLSVKIGFITLILGVLHFVNMFVFFKLRKRSLQEKSSINLPPIPNF